MFRYNLERVNDNKKLFMQPQSHMRWLVNRHLYISQYAHITQPIWGSNNNPEIRQNTVKSVISASP